MIQNSSMLDLYNFDIGCFNFFFFFIIWDVQGVSEKHIIL